MVISDDVPFEVVEEDLWNIKVLGQNLLEAQTAQQGTLFLIIQTEKGRGKTITNQREWLNVVVR